MPLLFSPVCSPTQLLQLQSFILFRICVCSVPPPLSCGACHTLATIGRLPLSKHTGGGGTTPAFSGWLVYLQFTWRSATLPLPGEACHALVAVTSFPLSKVAGQVPLLLPSPAGLFEWAVPLPHSLDLMVPHPLCYCLFYFFQLLVYYSVCFFLFFSLSGGQSLQGTMLIWPRVVCGSTVCRLAHLEVCFFQAG
jgi:hypothetical protein